MSDNDAVSNNDAVADEQDAFLFAVDWGDVYETPVLPVNQFLGQLGVPTLDGAPDGVCLVLGNVGPPVLTGADPEVRKRQADALKGTLHVMVHGRFLMSRERLEELIKVLQQTAANYDTSADAARRAGSAEGA